MATIQESREKLKEFQDRSKQKRAREKTRDYEWTRRENTGNHVSHQERVDELKRYGGSRSTTKQGKWITKEEIKTKSNSSRNK
jgi:hypothetical protein